MTWQPITRKELEALISAGLEEADDELKAAWRRIRVEPQKWACSPEGDLGGGFWVVAKSGGQVTWYDDIEDCFNVSPYVEEGAIGAYSCSQLGFAHCLRGLPEAKAVAHRAETVGVGEVPTELLTTGRIVKRQTTYWTLADTRGGCWRVHFTEKAEFHYAGAVFDSVSLLEAHPLLVDYVEPWASLFFKGTPRDPEATMKRASEVVTAGSSGWRCLEEYLNAQAPLSGGFGAFLSGPSPIVRRVEAILKRAGLSTSTLASHQPKVGRRVCLIGRSYVVANAFRFEFLGRAV